MRHEKRFSDDGKAAPWLAEHIAGRLQRAIDARSRASLVLPGGRSPAAFLRELAKLPLDWSRIWITLTDERWVDTTSDDSNERLLREHLLSGLASQAHFIPLKTSATLPGDALTDRGDALAAMPHPFDVVVIGMGEDGHIASLFPEALGLAEALHPEGAALLAAVDPPVAAYERITLTLAAMLDSHWILLPIKGETKLHAYAEAMAGASPLQRPVAALLRQNRVPVQVCLVEN
jgi:6-phosphogluconolactonase